MPSPTPKRLPVTCPDFDAPAGSRRCRHYLSNGACQRPDHFMCDEWLKVNPAPQARSTEQHQLFGAPECLPPAGSPTRSQATRRLQTPALLHDTHRGSSRAVHCLSEADIASFKALGVEVCLSSEELGDVWLVPAYTGAVAGVVDALSSLFGSGTKWQQGIRDLRASVRTGMAEGMGVQDLSFTKPAASPTGASAPRVQPLPPRTTAAPPGAAVGAPRATSPAPMPAVAAIGATLPPNITLQAPPPSPSPPVTVNLQVDGQTLATAVHRANRDAATRSFSPVPAY